MNESSATKKQYYVTKIQINQAESQHTLMVKNLEKWTPIKEDSDYDNEGQQLKSNQVGCGGRAGDNRSMPMVILGQQVCLGETMETPANLPQESSFGGPTQLATKRQKRPKFFASISGLFKNWLPIIQLSLLIQLQIAKTNCDDSTTSQLNQFAQDLSSQATELDQQQQFQQQLNQLSSSDLANVEENMLQSASQTNLQNAINNLPSSGSINGESIEAHFSNQLAGAEELSNAIGQESREQQQQNQQQFLEDLLESQTKALTSSSASSGSESSSASQSSDEKHSSQSGSPSNQNHVGSSILSEQLGTVTNLLQQIGAQQSGVLSEAIANSVANSIIKPALTSATSGNILQKPTNYNGANGNVNSRPLNVGQGFGGINGNIEYDSNNNQINGFIELPSFFNGSSKPSFGSSMKPLVLAALKTVPIKLGSVGWKLLQLIAWKKIYKTHHPKSGEIVIEEEVKGGHHHSMKGGGDMFGGKMGKFGGGKSMDMMNDLSAHMKSKGYGSSGGGSKMGYGGMGSGFGGGPMMATYGGGGGWPMGMDGSPAMAASMIYQRHLLPPAHMAQASGQQQQHQHSATAAAAAAAATAAAIQSQWVQNQLAEEMSERDYAAAPSMARQTSTNSTGGPNALYRKRSSMANGGNWFAAPAQAYAAAAVAANAASMAAVAQQQRHAANPFNRLLGGGSSGGNYDMPSPSDGFREALAGMIYQNLFDNAAAMAVQNAVKLPATNAFAGDYLEPADSSSGSSLSSLGGGSSFSEASSLAGNDGGWLGMDRSDQYNHAQLHSTGDNLLSLNEGRIGGGPPTPTPTDSTIGSNSLAAMTDFDDTPAGKMIGAAMNETSRTQQPIDWLRQASQKA